MGVITYILVRSSLTVVSPWGSAWSRRLQDWGGARAVAGLAATVEVPVRVQGEQGVCRHHTPVLSRQPGARLWSECAFACLPNVCPQQDVYLPPPST